MRQEKLVGSLKLEGIAKTAELKSKLADMLQGSGALLLAAEGTVPQIQGPKQIQRRSGGGASESLVGAATSPAAFAPSTAAAAAAGSRDGGAGEGDAVMCDAAANDGEERDVTMLRKGETPPAVWQGE